MATRIIHTCFWALVLLAVGCSSSGTDKKRSVGSGDIYDEARFADILYDLTLAESVYRLNLADSGAVRKREDVYTAILARHRTDSLVFDHNWNYYGGEPELMEKVYTRVTEKIDSQRVARGAQPNPTPAPEQP